MRVCAWVQLCDRFGGSAFAFQAELGELVPESDAHSHEQRGERHERLERRALDLRDAMRRGASGLPPGRDMAAGRRTVITPEPFSSGTCFGSSSKKPHDRSLSCAPPSNGSRSNHTCLPKASRFSTTVTCAQHSSSSSP